MSSSSKRFMAALSAAFLLGAALPAIAADTKPPACPKPVWPAEARRYELQGVTTLRFMLDDEGRVIEPKVAKSSGWDVLDQAGVKGLAACVFPVETAQKYPGKSLPVQYVWAMNGGDRARPALVEGSCAASERFSGFAPLPRGTAGLEGVHVRLLVNKDGTPFGVKTESRDTDPALVQEALAYMQSCRFVLENKPRDERSDAVTGRVLLK